MTHDRLKQIRDQLCDDMCCRIPNELLDYIDSLLSSRNIWKEQCRVLHEDVEKLRAELEETKEKFNRLLENTGD